MSGYLLSNAPLGQGQGGGVDSKPRHIGPPYYLVNDTFTTDRAAGAVNGTNAEPGPGKRTVTDDNSKLSLSGGSLSLATGGVGAGNPGLWYGALTRAAGLMCIAQFTHTAQGPHIGFDNGSSGQISDGIRPNATALTITLNNSTAIAVATISTSTTYRMAVVLRTIGSHFFIKGGAFTNWTLLFFGSLGAYNPSPGVTVVSTGSVATVDYIRVPTSLWLPTPLASDGFSAWGTSDGLGHAEGVAGGMGSGGSGLTWTDAVGTWGASGGVAVGTTAGGLAIATVSAAANVIVTAKLYWTGGKVGVVLRRGGTTNYVYVVHTGTHIQVYKRILNVETSLYDSPVTYVAGAELRVSADGSAFRIYYNNALITTQTISESQVQSSVLMGLYSTDDANTLDDFTVYARGGGEYAALDNY